jgi:hypothetical protein
VAFIRPSRVEDDHAVAPDTYAAQKSRAGKRARRTAIGNMARPSRPAPEVDEWGDADVDD